MLIDWMSLGVPLACFSEQDQDRLHNFGDRICRYTPSTGEVSWQTFAWESVRSDSHQVAVKVGSTSLHVQGSPGRCMGDGDAVFGAPMGLDPVSCAEAMLSVACAMLGVAEVAAADLWRVVCTRMDVTGNVALRDLAQVREALGWLRSVEGGRYRVSQQAGDTVYWSHRSRLRSGKAYAKGPHLRYLMRRPGYAGREYSEEEIRCADRLLRLELKLGSQWFRETAQCKWWQLGAGDLVELWRAFFGRMVGTVELGDGMGVAQRLMELEELDGSRVSKAQRRAAYATWTMIETRGWQFTRDHTSRSTFYRHLRLLRAVGLSDADLSAGRVVPLRGSALVLEPVATWEALRVA